MRGRFAGLGHLELRISLDRVYKVLNGVVGSAKRRNQKLVSMCKEDKAKNKEKMKLN